MKRPMPRRAGRYLQCSRRRHWPPGGRYSRIPVLAAVFLCMAHVVCAGGNVSSAGRADPPLAAVKVNIHHLAGVQAAGLEKVSRELIALKAGEAFSEAALRNALQRLRDSGIFEHIAVDTASGRPGPVRLRFDLTVFRLVKRIDIAGQFPLFEDEILGALGLRVGDAFTAERLKRGRQQLVELFEAQGFIDPAVEISVTPDAADGSVALSVIITKHGFYRLKGISISGNHHFSDNAIRAHMATWRASFWPGAAGRFLCADLKKDVRRLVARYRAAGFASATVKQRVDKNDARKEVAVALDITEGPRFDVTFAGNRLFSNRELQETLTLFKKGYRHGFSLRRSMRHIREKYIRAGYPRVRVTSETRDSTTAGAVIRRIRIIIDEGPLESVSRLVFYGNHFSDGKTLRKKMRTAANTGKAKRGFSPQLLAEDVKALLTFYRHRGFARAAVTTEVTRHAATHTVTVAVHIHEGVSTKVTSVEVVGLPRVFRNGFRDGLQVRAGEPLRRDLTEKDRALIAARVSEKGYPYAVVKEAVVFDHGGRAARVVYRVQPGRRTRLADVFVRGNFRTRPEVVFNAPAFKAGDWFSRQKILAGQRHLRNLAVFRDVRMRAVGLEQKDRDIVLVVNVGERKPYFVELGAGYDTRRGGFGLMTLGDRNLWGSAVFTQMHLFASQIGYGGNLSFRKAAVLGTLFGAEGHFFGQRLQEFNQPFGTESYGARIGISRSDWHDFTFSFKTGYQRRRQFQVEDFPIQSSNRDPRNVVDAQVLLQKDTRDSFLRPRKGSYSQASVYFSHGLDSNLDDFFKYRLETRYYWSPFKRLSFAAAARGGYIDMYGSTGDPAGDQLFYLGGIADVRGFGENLLRRDSAGKAVGGRTMFSGTLEARIGVGGSFELVTFLDTGMVGHPANPDSRGGLRFATGLGLNYITPVGPIGISYGYKLDRRSGEAPGSLHFSIGYSF